MNEREDSLSENLSSFSHKELQKELLDSPSMINNFSKETNNGLNEISQIYKDLSYSPIIKTDFNNQKLNDEEIENINFNNVKLDFYNHTEQIFAKTFFYYIDYEKTEEIEKIIDENDEKILLITFDDMNIIQYCSFNNKYNSLNVIIKQLSHKLKDNEKILQLINGKNKRGYNALHYSIIKGNNKIYDYLIKNGADTSIITNLGYNDIMLACQTKRAYIFAKEIKLKIINDNLNFDSLYEYKDKNNSTLLHWAAFSDFVFGIQFLLKNFRKDKNNFKFINFINYKDNNCMTALQYALMNNSNKVIFDLALLDNIDLNSEDNEGRNCYDYAKAMNNKLFDDIIQMKNFKSNIMKRIIFILLLFHNFTFN